MAVLSEKQRRFVDEYLVDLNATQAAIRAGYSDKNARSIGSQLLDKPHVAEAISTAVSARSQRTGITADRVLEELAAIAFANLADFAEWGSKTVKLKESKAVDGRVVAEVKHSEKQFGTDVGIKLHSKIDALKLLCLHLGLLAAPNEADPSSAVPITTIEVHPPTPAVPPTADAS